MKHIFFFLMGGCLAFLASLAQADAKTYRAPHGIAFQSAKKDLTPLGDISPSSGLEVSAEPVSNNDDVVLSPSTRTENCVLPQIEEKGGMFPFYFGGMAKVNQENGIIKVVTDAGTLHYNGELNMLRGIEIVPSIHNAQYPLQIRFWHGGGVQKRMVSVPVSVSDHDHPGFELLLQGGSTIFLNPSDFMPSDKSFSSSAMTCGTTAQTFVLSHPVFFSKKQVQRFQGLL